MLHGRHDSGVGDNQHEHDMAKFERLPVDSRRDCGVWGYADAGGGRDREVGCADIPYSNNTTTQKRKLS
jgi:hypothetical protein